MTNPPTEKVWTMRDGKMQIVDAVISDAQRRGEYAILEQLLQVGSTQEIMTFRTFLVRCKTLNPEAFVHSIVGAYNTEMLASLTAIANPVWKPEPAPKPKQPRFDIHSFVFGVLVSAFIVNAVVTALGRW